MSLKDVLSHPRIWRGSSGNTVGAVTVPTGFAALDRFLPGGGWPLRAITEIFLDRYGVGELSLLMPALSTLSATVPKRWIVWVAPPFVPYAPALLRFGIDLNRILLVHPAGSGRDALWATEQAIRSRSSAVTLAWLESANATALRRMQLGAEEHECWTVLFRPTTALPESSPAALRIRLSQPAAATTGASAPARRIEPEGRIEVNVLKCRGRRPRTISIERSTWSMPGSGEPQWR